MSAATAAIQAAENQRLVMDRDRKESFHVDKLEVNYDIDMTTPAVQYHPLFALILLFANANIFRLILIGSVGFIYLFITVN